MLNPLKNYGFIAVLLIMLCDSVYAGDKALTVSTAYYLDDRDVNSATLQLASTRHYYGFSLWGFSDFFADFDTKRRSDIDRSFSEYRLTYEDLPIKGLGIQAEYNYSSNNDNSVARLGLTYKRKYKLLGFPVYNQLRVFPHETDGDGGQLSLIYSIKFNPKLIFSGFADYNIREDLSNEWLVEPQLRYYFYKKFALALEYRFNGFQDANPNIDGRAWALGLWADF